MKVGLNTPRIESTAHDAQAAERSGFDYLGCGEHLFFHGPTPNAFIQLAAAAGATSRIRLVSSIALLPLYPAALAAKLAVTLDQVSHGRFELGVGAGGEYPAEFDAVGVDIASRFRRLDEGLQVMRRLFGGDQVSFSGEYTTLHDVALQPGPYQAGGPPIWLGGRKRGAIRRAGRLADVWMPYLVEPEKLHDTLAEVRSAASDAGRSANAISGAVFAWTCVDEDGAWARRSGISKVSSTYSQDFTGLADRYLVLGTPDEVVARFREFADAGADRVLIQLACEPEDRERVMATLAREVLPRLQAISD
ncbi:LLM class flavin-dependent oxidoreductase [Rhodococcus erythropolis]|uniref:LLM class flavin-dependent oxidoreductase n=1 Tax=Rhodococcus erythropolis TaxID=1833 RepID=UPI00380AF589